MPKNKKDTERIPTPPVEQEEDLPKIPTDQDLPLPTPPPPPVKKLTEAEKRALLTRRLLERRIADSKSISKAEMGKLLGMTVNEVAELIAAYIVKVRG